MTDFGRVALPMVTARTGAARWLLLGAVIAGVLAMHTLSAADSGGDHQPMTTISGSSSSLVMFVGMSMPGAGVDRSMPGGDMLATGFPVAATTVHGESGVGMSAMSCCVLFLVSVAGLGLLMRSSGPAGKAAAAGLPGGVRPWAVPQRAPPGPGRPRISLSVLRV